MAEEKESNTEDKGVSSVLKPLDCAEDHLSAAAKNLANGVHEGTKTYRNKRDASQKKKKDGAIEDFVDNVGGAVSEAVKEAAPAIEDVTKVLTGRDSNKKSIRKAVKAAAGFLPSGKNFPFGS